MASPHVVTRLLKDWPNCGQSALEALSRLEYAELRRLAASYLRRESPGHTLQPTALVHEAFLRLVGHAPDCQNRSQFYGVAAHLMRQILVDHARTRQAAKRGDTSYTYPWRRMVLSHEQDGDLMALDEALQRLAVLGLSVEESAEALDVSEVTVTRDRQFAKTGSCAN